MKRKSRLGRSCLQSTAGRWTGRPTANQSWRSLLRAVVHASCPLLAPQSRDGRRPDSPAHKLERLSVRLRHFLPLLLAAGLLTFAFLPASVDARNVYGTGFGLHDMSFTTTTNSAPTVANQIPDQTAPATTTRSVGESSALGTNVGGALPAVTAAESLTLAGPGDLEFVNGTRIDRVNLPDATGGLAPYRYEVSPLPMGLQCNQREVDPPNHLGCRRIWGTPSASTDGPLEATYSVTDANGASTAVTFDISVLDVFVLDWDEVDWSRTEGGSLNLSESYTVGGAEVSFAISGNIIGFANVPASHAVSPSTTNFHTGGLGLQETGLLILKQLQAQGPSTTLTIDFAHVDGVSDVRFDVFDVDGIAVLALERLEVTATASGVSVDPTQIVTGVDNEQIGDNAVQGTAVSGLGSNEANATFVFDQSGITQIRLVLSNRGAQPSEAGYTLHDISFSTGKRAPTVANAIPDQAATEGTAFSYTFPANTFSDADGDTLTYEADLPDRSDLPTWLTFTANTRTFSGTPQSADVGTLSVRVTASDGKGGSVPDTFNIVVSAANRAPTVANAIPDQTATAGTAFSYAFPSNTFSDADGDTLNYEADQSSGADLPTWLIFTAATRSFAGTPQAANVGTLTVRVTANDGSLSVSDAFDIVVSAANSAPVFTPNTASRSVAENSAARTNVGAALPAATDADGDSLTYSLGGTDAGLFDFNTATRQLTVATGDTLDHESNSTYSVTITADDGNGGTGTLTVTVTIIDQDEPPDAPSAPTVNVVVGSTTSLSVSWTAPANTGKPPITSYDVQYRQGATGTYTNGPQNVTGTTATITSLLANTSYEVRVRATNADGDSDWSTPTSGTTSNSAPVFTPNTAARSVAENSAAGTAVGAVLPQATDADGDSLTYLLGGIDASSFALDTMSRQLTVSTSADLDFESNSTYSVTITVNDGNGGADTLTVTVTIIDQDEPPDAPSAPTVNVVVGSTTSLSVSWTAPSNMGRPAITSYDVQYRQGATGTYTNGPQDVTTTSATITSLTANTSYEVRVRATNAEGDSDWSTPTSGTTPNSAPVFSPNTATRMVAENSAAGTNVGAVLPAATDADGDSLTYLLGGTDAASFALDTMSRQLTVSTSADLDFESNSTYSVTITVDDGNGGADTLAVTVTITDEDEPPSAPDAPMVNAAPGSTTSLSVTWTAPSNMGKPAITSYDVQYRQGATGTYLSGPQGVTGTTAVITSLTANTSYEVRVRATNAEGDSDWSTPTSGTTSNSAPVFTPNTAARSVAENSAAGTAVGAVLPQATDADGDSLTYLLGGIDASSFALDTMSRQLTVSTSADLDFESNSTYSVTITVDDGNGGADTLAVTVTITDEDEPPSAPDAPMVNAAPGSTTSLSVSWTAPSNMGRPAITSYDVQYRQGATGTYTNGPQNVTGTTATITSLLANTSYQVRVRATNAEGDSDWSTPTSGTTSNSAPVFTPNTASRSVAENSAGGTAVGAVLPAATDADTGDTLTYLLEGTDAALFDLNTATRQLTVATGDTLDHEAKPSHSVTITANDPNGGTGTLTVTITVTDEDEPPDAPSAPTVKAVARSSSRLSVSWTAPANMDKPAITSYDIQYRRGSSGAWTNGPQDITGTTATITRLSANRSYQVRVRATNAEGDSDWSTPTSGTTNRLRTLANSDPVFSPNTASRSVAENSAAGTAVGAALPQATDADRDSLTYSLGGIDAALFDFNTATRQLTVATGDTLDHESNSTYSVTITANDGSGGTDTLTVTITVTDTDEPPSAPDAPAVNAVAGASSRLSVSWTAPSNTGKPAITSYDIQYRRGSSGAWTNGPRDVTGTTAVITRLSGNTAYQVRVRATNAEGDGDWSTPASGTTNGAASNSAPTVANAIPDQTATVGTPFSYAIPANTFSDPDGDTLTCTADLADGLGLPTWLTFTAATHNFSGTPQAANVGTLSVRLTASDGDLSVADTFDIVVSAANRGLIVGNEIPRETPSTTPTPAPRRTPTPTVTPTATPAVTPTPRPTPTPTQDPAQDPTAAPSPTPTSSAPSPALEAPDWLSGWLLPLWVLIVLIVVIAMLIRLAVLISRRRRGVARR